MTDIFSEEAGRAIVEKTEFTKEAIWLPLLAVHHQNAGQPIIKDKTFTDCLIEGPALMVPVNGCEFEGCNLGATKDPNSLFYSPKGPVLVGAVPFENCRFINCRFSQVAFTGHADLIEQMATGLSSASEAS